MVKHGIHKMPNGTMMSDAEMAEHMGGRRSKKPSKRRSVAKSARKAAKRRGGKK